MKKIFFDFLESGKEFWKFMRECNLGMYDIEDLNEIAKNFKFLLCHIVSNQTASANLISFIYNVIKNIDEEDKYKDVILCNIAEDIIIPGIEDKYESEAYLIAEHKNTPITILRELADYGGEGARCTIAERDDTPLDVLKKLATDEEERVWETALNNNRCPKPDVSERKHLKETSKLIIETSNFIGEDMPGEVAEKIREGLGSEVKIEIKPSKVIIESVQDEKLFFYYRQGFVFLPVVQTSRILIMTKSGKESDTGWTSDAITGVYKG